jgi:hypothetical protein
MGNSGCCENLELLQLMENSVYEKVAEYLMLIGRTELLTCSATQTSFTRIRDQAQQVSGIHQECCMQHHVQSVCEWGTSGLLYAASRSVCL